MNRQTNFRQAPVGWIARTVPVAFFLLSILGAALPCRAVEPTSLQFYKDVQQAAPSKTTPDDKPSDTKKPNTKKPERMLSVNLDTEIYAVARDGYPDLRVFTAQDVEVPFLLEKATQYRSRTVRHASPSKVRSLKEKDDNSIEIVVHLDKKARSADGLTFSTPQIDHERRVTVYGSRSGNEWEELLSDGLIFDYTRYMDISNREVRLKKNSSRRYRIVIAEAIDQRESSLKRVTRHLRDGEEQDRTETTTVRRRPFRIDRIECWHNISTKRVRGPKQIDYPIAKFTTTEDDDKKQTIIEVRTNREPLTSLTLQTDDRNFSRPAVVERPVERGIRTEWVRVGGTTLSLVELGSFRRENLKITFPEQREEAYRIVIHNEDNRPLSITGVTARGNNHRMVFLAEPGEKYRVCFGSAAVEKPSYETATVLAPLLARGEPTPVELGPRKSNAAFGQPSGQALRRFLNNRYFLIGAVCLMVVVLGWGLYRAGQRIEQIPQ